MRRLQALVRGGSWIVVLAAAVSCNSSSNAPANSAPAPPLVVTPLAATLVGGSVTVTGQNFGARGAATNVVLVSGGSTVRVASTDASITAWTDARETLNEKEILEVTGLPPAPELVNRPLAAAQATAHERAREV